MKWFTGCNQSSLEDPQFRDLLRVAVLSAKHNTSLDRYLIYDGEQCDEIDWLESHGVRVLRTTLSFYEPLREFVLANFSHELLRIRSGAFLRTEIPVAMEKSGLCDPFVLYTDADVVFAADPRLDKYRPQYFAACGAKGGGLTRFNIGGEYHFNSGVMLMNTIALRSEYDRFVEFVINNGFGAKRPPHHALMQKNLFLSDQAALNLYYKNRIKRLDDVFNWNPARGRNPHARIIHFNGLKWTQWDSFLQRKLRPDRQAKFEKQIRRNRSDYEQYVTWSAAFLTNNPSTRPGMQVSENA